MTSVTQSTLAAAALVLPALPVNAAEFSGYVTLTSDYVWRGVTQSEGDPAVQLGVEASFDSGVYAGLWGSTVDINTGDDRQRDTEINYYLGYSLDLASRWVLGTTVVIYTYPGQTGPFNYNYEEYAVSVNYDDRAWLEYAYSPGYYGFDIDSHNVELITEWPAGEHLIVSGGAGYFDFSSPLDDAYAYWNLGITWPVNRFSVDLRYHDTSGPVLFVSTADRADARLALSFRVAF